MTYPVRKLTFVPHDNATAVDATIETIRAILSLSSTILNSNKCGSLNCRLVLVAVEGMLFAELGP